MIPLKGGPTQFLEFITVIPCAPQKILNVNNIVIIIKTYGSQIKIEGSLKIEEAIL